MPLEHQAQGVPHLWQARGPGFESPMLHRKSEFKTARPFHSERPFGTQTGEGALKKALNPCWRTAPLHVGIWRHASRAGRCPTDLACRGSHTVSLAAGALSAIRKWISSSFSIADAVDEELLMLSSTSRAHAALPVLAAATRRDPPAPADSSAPCRNQGIRRGARTPPPARPFVHVAGTSGNQSVPGRIRVRQSLT
jgi:hypothetical protein